MLDIAKTGPTHVVDNRVAQDGYPIEDVERALAPGNLQTVLGTTETDEQALWDMLIARAEGREATPSFEVVVAPADEVVTEIPTEVSLAKEVEAEVVEADTTVEAPAEEKVETEPEPVVETKAPAKRGRKPKAN